MTWEGELDVQDTPAAEASPSDAERTPGPPRIPSAFHPVLAAAGVVLVTLPFARLHLDQRHDGYMFNAALDVARGEVLFRDTAMIYGPISTWVHAAAIEVLGARVLSIRLATVAAYGVAAAVFFLVWRRFMPAAWAFVAVGLWFVYADFFREDRPLYPWSSVYLLVFHGLAMYTRIRAIEASGTSARWWNAGAGVAAAGAALCRQASGVALLAALVVPPLLARKAKRTVGDVVGGFVAALCAFAAWAVLHSAADDAVDQLVLYPIRWADGMADGGLLRTMVSETAVAVPVVVGLWILAKNVATRCEPEQRFTCALAGLVIGVVAVHAFGPTRQLWILSTAVALGGCAALRRTLADRALTTFDATVVLAAAGLVQLAPVPDISHVWWSVAAGLGMVLAFVWRLGPRRVPALAFVVGVTTALAVPLVSEAAGTLGGRWVALHDESGITEGMRVRPGGLTDFDPFLRVLDRVDDDYPVLNIGPNAFWQAFTRAPNVDAYTETFTPWMLQAEALKRRQNYLKSARPVVTTVYPAIASGLTNRLDYVLIEQMHVREWEGYEYFLLVPRELAMEK